MSAPGPTYRDAAPWYDAIHDARGKDYHAEAVTILELAGRPVHSVLDVACGTGRHLAAFREHVDEAVGLDGSPDMVAVASERLPADVRLVEADFRAFDLGRRFDLVTCLFSSIGYVEDGDDLDAAVACMAEHLGPGGMLCIEPWLTPDRVIPDGVRVVETAELDDGVVARAASSWAEGEVLVVEFGWAAATTRGASTVEEHHRMRVFTRERYLAACATAGLDAQWRDEEPAFSAGRGLIVARRG